MFSMVGGPRTTKMSKNTEIPTFHLREIVRSLCTGSESPCHICGPRHHLELGEILANCRCPKLRLPPLTHAHSKLIKFIPNPKYLLSYKKNIQVTHEEIYTVCFFEEEEPKCSNWRKLNLGWSLLSGIYTHTHTMQNIFKRALLQIGWLLEIRK